MKILNFIINLNNQSKILTSFITNEIDCLLKYKNKILIYAFLYRLIFISILYFIYYFIFVIKSLFLLHFFLMKYVNCLKNIENK